VKSRAIEGCVTAQAFLFVVSERKQTRERGKVREKQWPARRALKTFGNALGQLVLRFSLTFHPV
jgi:hypothetical protein